MFRPHKRVTWRQRRLIRHLSRSRHASVQDAALHELHRSMRRSHGLKPPKAPSISGHGTWRPPTRRAKALLARLRAARQWNVKKNILAEIARELEHGRRIAERVRQAARSAAERAGKAAERVSAAAGRAQERAGRAGREIGKRGRQGQEKLLARAERRQAEREAGKRRPALSARARAAVRSRAAAMRGRNVIRLPARLRAARSRQQKRAAPRDPGWERSRYNPQSPRFRPLAERPRNRGRGPRPVPARRRTPRTPVRTR